MVDARDSPASAPGLCDINEPGGGPVAASKGIGNRW